MNILFTTFQGGLAGSTFSIKYLAMGLLERGHTIHIACPADSLLWRELEVMPNVHLHHVKFSSYIDIRSARKVAFLTRMHQIDIINAQSGRDRNLVIVAKMLFGANSKVVFTRRQRPRNEPWLKRFFHIRFTERIVLVSEGLQRLFLEKGYPKKHLHVIYNGVPSEIIKSITLQQKTELKKQWGLEGNVVGCISRKKKQEDIIRALAHVNSPLSVLFVGIGETDLKDELAKENPKQNIVFTGAIPQDQALRLLQIMDVNILASHMDGFGLVLVESMLAGVPVIGSDFGGIPDVIEDGKSGFLYPNGDAKRLAFCIDKILEDSELKSQLIARGTERAEDKFLIKRTVEEYEQLFISLLS